MTAPPSETPPAAARPTRETIGSLRRKLAAAAERERELRTAGGMLANIAFNLAQNGRLTGDVRRSLDETRKHWDAIAEKHFAARAGLPRDGTEETTP